MSGLQASISTHIARRYFYGSSYQIDSADKWGINIPLFTRSVGSHPDRLNNLYFAFLFVLRAVIKIEPILSNYPYDTGNHIEDEKISDFMKTLVSGQLNTSRVLIYSIDKFIA
jgi:ERO1-like protein alpha